MKIAINFKCPDAFDQVTEDMVKYDENDNRIEPDEEEVERIKDKMSKWITYGEYVRVVYDTELDKMTVAQIKYDDWSKE